LAVAKENALSCIVDDGLLIKGNRILAGASAKREASKIASVKRALFFDPEHAAAVKNAIASEHIDSLLVLGTSEHMACEIAKRLGIPQISHYINITDISSAGDIMAALDSRRREGKHVIPAPTFALKKEFSGYFMDPLKRFAHKGRRHADSTGERTVVRPTFSYLGSYTISRRAIEQLASLIASSVQNVGGVLDVKLEFSNAALSLEVALAVIYGCKIHETLQNVASCLRGEIDRQTALHVTAVAVTAKSLIVR
jgi:uncharacterized alkaline shock family protein YloU